MTRDALISIRPRYVDAILSGTKTVELRRRMPAIAPGSRLWIYATMPVGALVGTADVDAVVRGSPDHIWALHRQNAGVCRDQFEAYYRDSEIAHGISLVNVKNGRPVTIDTLRTIKPRFHPPQVMIRITEEEAEMFERHLFGGNHTVGASPVQSGILRNSCHNLPI